MPDPEVLDRPRRRRLTAADKLSILRELDACTEPGKAGAVLRREGLYSSHLSDWRRKRETGELLALAPGKKGRPQKPSNPLTPEVTRVGTLSNDFFVHILDMGTSWVPTSDDQQESEGRDRATGALEWTATRVDLVFGANSQLRALTEVYACDGAERKFVRDFVAAWARLMELDPVACGNRGADRPRPRRWIRGRRPSGSRCRCSRRSH